MVDLYEMKIVPEGRYGGFPKILTLYELISSGKCLTLEGKNGAFRVMKSEIRRREIYVNADNLLDNPERAKEGQVLLKKELQGIHDRIDSILKSNEKILSSFNNSNWNRNQIRRQLEEILEDSEFRKYIRECEEKMERYTERLKELTGGTFKLSEVDYSDLD